MMKKLSYLGVGMAAVLTASVACAESTLLVSENVVVTKIDGQTVSNGLLSGPATQFKLPAGDHTVTAKYKRLYELTSDDHDVLRSVELTTAVNMQDGQTYRVEMLNQPEDYEAAKDYAKKPTLAVLQNNKVLAQKTAIVASSGGLLGGIGKSIGGLFSDTSQPVQVNTTATTTNSPAQRTVQAHAANTTTLDNFMKLWLEATPAEREKIKSWVKDQ